MARKQQKSNTKLVHINNKEIRGWKQAIEIAEQRVLFHEMRRQQFKAALVILREKAKAGDDWPGAEALGFEPSTRN